MELSTELLEGDAQMIDFSKRKHDNVAASYFGPTPTRGRGMSLSGIPKGRFNAIFGKRGPNGYPLVVTSEGKVREDRSDHEGGIPGRAS